MRGQPLVALSALVSAALLGTTVPAYAATETEHGSETQIDVNPNTQNPCTGDGRRPSR